MNEVNHVIVYDNVASYNMQTNPDVQLFFVCLAIMTFLFVLVVWANERWRITRKIKQLFKLTKQDKR